MAPWVAANLGKQVTMIYPDYAFGYDHRDNFTAAIEEQGGEVIELLAIPPTETSFTRNYPQIPRDTEVLYHVMVGPAVLTFVKELGEFYGTGDHPAIFGFIDSLEAVDIDTPGLEFLDGVGRDVVADAPVAVLHQTAHDPGAHPAEPDHSELHGGVRGHSVPLPVVRPHSWRARRSKPG